MFDENFFVGTDGSEIVMNAAIDKYIENLADLRQFSGAVLVADKEGVLLRKGYGMASYELDVPNTPKSRFRIGSVTKLITAVAIMLLYERKLLNIDDKLTRFIPDYPNGNNITIHNLLTHTSGISNFSSFPEFRDLLRSNTSINNLIDLFKTRPVQCVPGAEYCYSNSGYVLLGFILEKVTEQSYGSFIDANIFKPLYMYDTGFEHSQEIIKYRATGYTISESHLINAQYCNISVLHGSGALYSTIDDLFLFIKGLYSGKLMAKVYVEKMLTNCFDNKKSKIGYGCTISDGRVVSYGWIDGFHSIILMDQINELVSILLGNIDLAPVKLLSNNILRIIQGKDPEEIKKHTNKADMLEIPNNGIYVGQYSNKHNETVNIVSNDENSLFIDFKLFDRMLKYRIYPYFDDKEMTVFSSDMVGTEAIFIKDLTGNVMRAVLKVDDEKTILRKL